MFDEIVRHAAARYRPMGEVVWRFAQEKLRRDPVYQAVLEGPWLGNAGTLLDVGCGQGLMLSLVVSSWELRPNHAGPKRLVGVELRTKVAEIARRALTGKAEVMTADVREKNFPRANVILVFDVFHMMPAGDQDALLKALVATLEAGGVLLMRDVDASAGWRFQAVNFANRFKALVKGYSSRSFYFRSTAEWKKWLEAAGLDVETKPMGQGTPFGNVLFVGTKRRQPAVN